MIIEPTAGRKRYRTYNPPTDDKPAGDDLKRVPYIIRVH